MRIFFLASYCIPIHAGSLKERPLGGTETGLIRLAECLHARGHEVKVFTSHPSPPPSPPESPQYLPVSAIPLAGDCDCLVVVQNCQDVFTPIKAKKVIYWTGDGPEQLTTFGIGDDRFKKRVDAIFAVSNWHKEALSVQGGFAPERIKVIRNGVHLKLFENEKARQEIRLRQRLIFSSAPHRGLAPALEIFKTLRTIFPALELHAFSGFELYDREKPFHGPQTASFAQLKNECQETEGCYLHGNIQQGELAREYLRSGLYIYPATVPETSCITAIEAKAAGCPAVVSSLGALPETVGKCGAVIPGEPESKQFMRRFVEASAKIISDDALWKGLSAKSITEARAHYSWENVADRFIETVAS